MDALCLFDDSSRRIVAVNASWSRLFGYTALDALGMQVDALASSPDEFRRRLELGAARELQYRARGEFKKSNGAAFSAGFTLTAHAQGSSLIVALVVEDPASVIVDARAATLTAIDEEVASDTGVPSHLKAAMRDRMARCARQQAALLHLASVDDHDFGELSRKLLRTDAETLGVARVSYWTLDKTGRAIVCQALYDRDKLGFESGLTLTAADYPIYFDALETGALIAAHDALGDPRTAEFGPGYLRPLGIGAMLDVPVFLRGDLVGIVCHEHVGDSRGWTMDEQQFAMSVGQFFSMALATRHRDEAARNAKRQQVMLAEANDVLDRKARADDGWLTGQTLGNYRLGRLLGRGGMGEVYRAIRVDDRAEVAVKVLRKSRVADPAEVERFFREAELMRAVGTQHVAKVYETGRFDGGTPFIAMEVLEGHDLAWHLRRSPELPLDQVIELVEHAARALGAVHAAGVVHRDLKPANLFLVDALPRAWKVVDFGVSQPEGAMPAEGSDELAGTPQYMAPEHVAGQAVDRRADIYSLATIAYRALAGRAPFIGELPAVLASVLTESAPPLSEFARGVHPDLDLVFAVALAKSPDDRFSEAPSFGQALRDAAAGRLSAHLRARGEALLGTFTGRLSLVETRVP